MYIRTHNTVRADLRATSSIGCALLAMAAISVILGCAVLYGHWFVPDYVLGVKHAFMLLGLAFALVIPIATFLPAHEYTVKDRGYSRLSELAAFIGFAWKDEEDKLEAILKGLPKDLQKKPNPKLEEWQTQRDKLVLALGEGYQDPNSPQGRAQMQEQIQKHNGEIRMLAEQLQAFTQQYIQVGDRSLQPS